MRDDHTSLMHPEQTAHAGGDYFRTVLRHGAVAGIFHPEDTTQLQLGLYTLLAEETARYTMGDSSSIPVETAQSLYRSICFCLGLRLSRTGTLSDAARLMKEQALPALFLEGRALVRQELERGKQLFRKLQECGFETQNRAYLATCNEALPQFFQRYDFWHGTHDIPCMIDYPLCFPMEGEGIAYVNAYLEQLLVETRFLLQFDQRTVARLLRGHCPEPDEALIDLFEPVYWNAMGRALLKLSIRPLNIRGTGRMALWRLMEGCSEDRLKELLHSAGTMLLNMEGIRHDDALCAYLRRAEAELLNRILAQRTEEALLGIFTAFPETEQKKPSIRYRKRKPMDDEALRDLIEELREMRFLSDKLSLLTRNVRALEDWLEIVPLCFAEEELPHVYRMLSDEEIAAVLRRLRDRYSGQPGEEPELWETAFVRFIKDMDPERQSQIRLLSQADWKDERFSI